MDSRQDFGFNIVNGDRPSISAPNPLGSVPSRMSGSLNKLNSRGSPVSPFSTHSDCDAVCILSDGKEHCSSTGSLSTKSPSCNSPLETSSYHHRHHNQLESSPVGDSLPDTEYGVHMKRLQLLETVLMGTDGEEDGVSAANPATPSIQDRQGLRFTDPQPSSVFGRTKLREESPPEKRHKSSEETLKELLIECAKALLDIRIDDFERLVERARKEVSISGEPIQRLGAYMIEGLVARKESSGTNIYQALKCKEPLGRDLLSYMHILYEICPYLKFGYMAANGAIAEACRNDDYIHIIDFQIAQGNQWFPLLQALAGKPGGPPKVRITGIDDPVSKYARGGASLEDVGKRLAQISEKHNISVEFNALPVYGPDVRREMLDVRPGEALAVNFPLQLHHTPDESVDVNNPRDGLLRMVKSLGPKVTTLVEQESNANTTPFLTRFIETQGYYSAMFESIEVTMQRDRKERINVEQHCLAKDIVNIIACEGRERVERHEVFGKWKSRFTMAGFRQYPLSSYVNSVIRSLLRCYSEHYTLVEKDGAMLLGWKERMLISASAWH